ncbi:hypothetical protein IWX76_001555 [Pedobacter sp. CAN_A7]|uniref:hypothetical protein n=1 Tax=Pedobacter sp. CAN_A7 TaxID=2787722 RepID=UPI0018C8F68D
MHKVLITVFKLGLMLMFLCTSASAQQNNFEKSIGQQSGVYNGRDFEFYHPSIEGSAFFQDATFFTNGTIHYDGFVYRNVPLMYDMHKDLVVSLFHDGFSKYSFISEKVSEFDMLGHHFVRIVQNSAGTSLNSGFYDQVYNGKLKILVKRSRELKEESSIQELKNVFRDHNKYYLKKDQQYYNVGSKKAFMKLFKERKSQLQRVLKDADIIFRKEPERALVLLATSYDNLSN